MTALCLPWWHKFGSIKGSVPSGCTTDKATGNVPCSPEAMRKAAETWLQNAGHWPKGKPLPLATYTLARYMTTEVGGGTPEERVAVGEAAVNRARLWKRDVNQLLLYRQKPGHPNYGYYGPIHGYDASGKIDVRTAPYGRWAASSKDPQIADVLLADLVMTGQTNNFARGADNQVGMEYTKAFPDPAAKVRKEAAEGNYWVGPLPGVDHWHTFLWRQLKISPDTATGRALLEQGLAAVANRSRPDWSHLQPCPVGASGGGLVLPQGNVGVPTFVGPLVAFGGLLAVGLLGVVFLRRRSLDVGV